MTEMRTCGRLIEPDEVSVHEKIMIMAGGYGTLLDSSSRTKQGCACFRSPGTWEATHVLVVRMIELVMEGMMQDAADGWRRQVSHW